MNAPRRPPSSKEHERRVGRRPTKLAAALLIIAVLDTPPLRFGAGADVLTGVKPEAHLLLAQIDAHGELSSATEIGDCA